MNIIYFSHISDDEHMTDEVFPWESAHCTEAVERWMSQTPVLLTLLNDTFHALFPISMVIISPNEVFGDIMVLASPPRPPQRPPVDPDEREHSNSTNIQPISFKFYMRVNTPLRYFTIEIWYPPMTRTTAFTAKRHSYPPNLKNAISP